MVVGVGWAMLHWLEIVFYAPGHVDILVRVALVS